ncbi:hypothetical protein PMAYCL1PPCAC_09537, partial [Pristionchus mayeri]
MLHWRRCSLLHSAPFARPCTRRGRNRAPPVEESHPSSLSRLFGPSLPISFTKFRSYIPAFRYCCK